MKFKAKYLIVPINCHVSKKNVSFYDKDGNPIFEFETFLDALNPKFYMYYDVERFRGMDLQAVIEPAMEIEFSMAEERPMEGVYDGYLRPTIHFSAAYGWINDPNGLVYHNGVYHLFFQYNPLAPVWGNMHWGHATSTDLLHWREEDIALFPNEMGDNYSGSGICDKDNASGLSPDGNTLLLYYTAAPGSRLSAGKKTTQCLVYSTDGGKTFINYSGNPVVPWIAGGNRDPKVVRCDELGCYLMALYISEDAGIQTTRDEYWILESSDLIHWNPLQSIHIPESWECPDFFPLTADNGERKWVFTNAEDRYLVGHMDADTRRFVTENSGKWGTYGGWSFAAQTFSGISDRVVRMAWHRTDSDGIPFCGEMSVPQELKLVYLNGEYYLKILPIPELDSLAKTIRTSVGKAELSKTAAHDITIRVPKGSDDFTVTVFGIPFEAKTAENRFLFGEMVMPLSHTGGDIEIRLIVDTITVECYLDGGLIHSVIPRRLDKNLNSLTVTAENAEITVKELNSIH